MSRPSIESWRTMSRLLDEVLDLERHERPGWVSKLREREPAAAEAVSAWLHEFEVMEAGGFLEDRRAHEPVRAALVGLEVGAYRLVEPIDHGGMGTVWLAERRDGRFDQRVAVKMLQAARMDSAGMERFSREATILARMTHPKIAHLIDAGVSPLGAPYLVLEHVQGEHIDVYCDQNRLSVHDRLRLFLDVLEPVAYAHANLIVHRDLKPSNVLVSADGHVKLLDFGIAKLLDSDEALAAAMGTQDGALTPASAAPEQLTGGAITTATDVYALGVLLYRLLTGRHPSAEGALSAAALVEAVVQRDPVRPSAAVVRPDVPDGESSESIAKARSATPKRLQQMLSGDLDTVVAKALKKNPSERYSTVMAFADDICRYLMREPIAARPDSVTYRVTKFVQRNRVAAVFAGVALLALVGGLIGTITQARRATEQRDFARRQLARAEAINDLNAFLISDAAPMGSTFTARDLLERAERILTQQAVDTDGVRVESLVAIGSLYTSVGETAKASEVLHRAYELAAAVPDPSIQGKASCTLGRAVAKTGDMARARQLVDAGLSAIPDEPQFALARVVCRLAAAGTENWAGAGDQAVTHVLAARSIAEASGVVSPLLSLRFAMDLAESYRIAGRYAEANATFVDAHERLIAMGREDTERASNLLNNWGLVLSTLGRPRDAERMLRRSIEITSSGGSDERIEPVSWSNLAGVLFDLGRYAEGIELASRAHQRALARGDNVVADQALLVGARLRVVHGDVEQGEAMLNEVESHFKSMFPPTHVAFLAVAVDRIRVAEVRGQLENAASLADSAWALAQGDDRRRSFQVSILRRRSEVYVKLRRYAEARADAERSMALAAERMPPGSHAGGIGLAYLTIGEAYAGEARIPEAREALKMAMEHLEDAAGQDHPGALRARELLSRM